MAYRHFTEMPVWQKAHEVVLRVYKLTAAFPESEKYALTSQIRRAAVSITSNVAEAFGRQTGKDKARFTFTPAARATRCRVRPTSHAM